MSLGYKLPLLIGALLVAAIAVVATAAYVEMRATSMRVASERLISITGQFRDLLGQSAGQLRAAIATPARADAVVRFARTRNPADRPAALAALAQGPSADQIVATELRDAGGKVILSTHPDRGVGAFATNDVIPRNEPGDSAAVGLYRVVRDTTVYPVASVVRGVDDLYVVRWRRIAGTQRARETLNRLVGSDAAIFVGNADGSHWTDLERPVSGIPTLGGVSSSGTRSQTYRRGADSVRYLAASAAIPGTPWVVTIDFPTSSILAPAARFMRNMTLLSAAVLAIVLVAGWFMSRRITTPLLQLTEAAGAVAAGDFTKRVHIKRSDELGRLGRAFAVMADEVRQTRDDLEKRVERRTHDLNQTLKQLHDAQDTLVRKEKLAMLGQLSSGVGHELRNPLGVMTNAVYYLKAVLTAQPKNVHEYLDILSQQITLSEKIVGDLMDFARQKPPRRLPTHLAEVTKEQIARLGRTDGLVIHTDVPSSLPPVLVDPVHLGQILLNLFTNASQAMDGRGTITVRAHPNHTGVIYEVSDTGPGVSKENIDKIFEPLFTTKARGIGLGLAVSRTLARANEAELTVESAPGKGATFRLTLVAAGVAAPSHAPTPVAQAALS